MSKSARVRTFRSVMTRTWLRLCYTRVYARVCVVRATNSRFDAASVNNRIPRSINAFHREEARVNVSLADWMEHRCSLWAVKVHVKVIFSESDRYCIVWLSNNFSVNGFRLFAGFWKLPLSVFLLERVKRISICCQSNLLEISFG